MLRLSWEQFELLEQLAARRHAVGIGTVLAGAWPEITERLQDRWPAFVEAAVAQGRRHGLAAPPDLARYASLWCIWGPSFDSRPGFEWAAEILGDHRRGASLKLHQLAHRTRDELRRRQTTPSAQAGGAQAPTPEQLDAALASVDARIGPLSAARSVFPDEAVQVAARPCDVGSVDLLLGDPDDLQEYRHGGAGWHRTPVPRSSDPPLRWTHAPEGPLALAVASRALRQGPPARLNVRVETLEVCDPKVHPEVVHVGVEGHLAWRGRDTARLSLAVYAEADTRGEGPSPAGIGATTPVDAQTVTIASHGVRDTGAPFGDIHIQLRVVPATQWLAEVTHAAVAPMSWPPDGPATAVPARCRLERDGTAFAAAGWQRAWDGLQGALRQGFERAWNDWVRVFPVSSAGLVADISPLVGQAGFTWGWRRTATDAVAIRVEGAVDMIAFACDVTFNGELVDGDARAQVRIACKSRHELRMGVSQLGETAAEGRSLKAVQESWRVPMTLELEPLAASGAATLVAAPVPQAVTGALAGECGLRPRPDGRGLQWFFSLRLEPVDIVVDTIDPLLGRSRRTHKLLPAIWLADWSAG